MEKEWRQWSIRRREREPGLALLFRIEIRVQYSFPSSRPCLSSCVWAGDRSACYLIAPQLVMEWRNQPLDRKRQEVDADVEVEEWRQERRETEAESGVERNGRRRRQTDKLSECVERSVLLCKGSATESGRTTEVGVAMGSLTHQGWHREQEEEEEAV